MSWGSTLNDGYGGQSAVVHSVAKAPKTHGVAGVEHRVASAQTPTRGLSTGGLVLQDAVVPFTVAALAITLLLLAAVRLLRKPPPTSD